MYISTQSGQFGYCSYSAMLPIIAPFASIVWQRGMLAVPVCRGLIGVTGAHQYFLFKVTTDKLERERGTSTGEAARKGDRGAAGHVERHRVTHQGVQHLGIL